MRAAIERRPHRSRARRIIRSIVTVVVALAGAGLWAASQADAMVVWAPGAVVAPPANAASDPMVTVIAISCASAGNCTIVGSYMDSSGSQQGLLAIQSAGVWSTATEAILPTNAGGDPAVKLTGVSCASAGNCTAIGSYMDSAGHTQGLGLTETSGTWARGVELIHPAFVNVAADPRISLTAVSCATAGNCSVVGTYLDNNGHPDGMLLTQINGAWGTSPARDAEATLPGDAAAEPAVSLTSVSCGAIGDCVGVGNYTDSSGHQQGLEIPETNTTWGTGRAALLPAGAATNPAVSVSSVSCTSAGECAAVGNYNDTSNHTLGLLLSESAGTWITGLAAMLPPDAASSPAVSLTSVSCPSAGNCDAVGYYNDTSGDLQGLMVTESSGSWASGVAPTIPADAGASVFVQLLSVSCADAGDCVAVGNYLDDSFVAHPLLLAQSGGSWSPGVEAALPFGGQSPFADGETVACATSGVCAAAIGYTDMAGNSVAADVNGTRTSPATPTITMSTPPPQVELGAVIPRADLSTTLMGGSSETGTVSLIVFGPQASPPASCAAGGTTVYAQPVVGDGTYTSSADFTPAGPGTYWWYASYGGDLGNAPASSACDAAMPDTVVTAPGLSLSGPAVGTTGTAIPGSALAAALTGVSAQAGGTITVSVFGPQSSPPSSCDAGGAVLGTAMVQSGGTYAPAGSFTPGSAGDYWWYAHYGGDASNPPAASPCGAQMAETTVYDPPAPTVTGPAALNVSPTPTTSPTPTPTSGKPPAGTSALLRVHVRGFQVVLTVACHGTAHQSCSDRLILTVTERLSGGRVVGVIAGRAPTARRVVTIGTLRVVVAGGRTRKLSISLNRLGRELVAIYRPLTARLELIQGPERRTLVVGLHFELRNHQR